MAFTSGSSPETLIPGLMEIVGTEFERHQPMYPQITKSGSSQRQFEEILGATTIPAAQLKPNGQPVVKVNPLAGEKVRATHTTTAIAIEIEREAYDDDLYKGANSPLADLGGQIARSMIETQEIQGHRFFNAEGYLTSGVPDELQPLQVPADTRSLFNTAHPGLAGGEVGNQANRPTVDADLSVTSYRAALSQFMLYRDDRNNRINIGMPEKLLVHPENVWNAREITGSTYRPDTANNTENVSAGMTSVMQSPYLEDADAWALLSPNSPYFKCYFIFRERPNMDSWTDSNTRGLTFAGFQRFSIRAAHWLSTYGSPGA